MKSVALIVVTFLALPIVAGTRESAGASPESQGVVDKTKDVAGKKRIDLKRDPPPDLVLEVYISYFTIDKRRVYAAMGVPEIWSYDAGELHILQLKRGKYESRETSASLPFLKRQDLQRFLEMLESEEETAVLSDWMDFVRKRFAGESR